MQYHWYYFLGYVWSLPGTVLGLLLALVYRPKKWRWSQGCLEAIGGDKIWGKPGAQTHGWIIYYRDERAQANEVLRVHERVHVIQAFIGGIFYMLIYGGHFLWNWARDDFGPWVRAYRKICWEKQAYHIDAEFEAGQRPGAWGSFG